jgi:hypothetical protein
MHRSLFVAPLVVAMLSVVSRAAAQDSTFPPVAARVRVTINEAGQARELTGNLLALNRDSILFSPGRQALPIDRLIRLEVRDGTQHHPFAGLFIGAAVGAIVGATWAASNASHHQQTQFGVRPDYTPGVMAVYGGIAGVGVGAPVGLVIGLFNYDRWTAVKIPR